MAAVEPNGINYERGSHEARIASLENSKLSLPAVISVATLLFAVIVAIGTAVKIPMDDRLTGIQGDFRRELDELKKSMSESFDATRGELLARSSDRYTGAMAAQDKVEIKSQFKEITDKFSAELISLRDSQVPRGEHEGHWREEATSVTGLQREIDQIQATQGNVYTQRDALLEQRQTIADMQKEIEQLRTTVLNKGE